jgi:ABC-type bacteriocin/lantibiotic exporter with double-glycine peptidase domain
MFLTGGAFLVVEQSVSATTILTLFIAVTNITELLLGASAIERKISRGRGALKALAQLIDFPEEDFEVDRWEAVKVWEELGFDLELGFGRRILGFGRQFGR